MSFSSKNLARVSPVDDSRAQAVGRIRETTREVHRDLEALPIWNVAFNDLDAYAALLDGLLSLVRPADEAIGESLGSAAPERFCSATRTAWLANDRRDVAKRRGKPSVPSDPPDDAGIRTIAEESPSSAAGTLYVIEGSALGGRILSRRLRESLGFDGACGGRYFHGHGAETGVRWTSFLAWLSDSLLRDEDAETAARAARCVFERFHERLSGLAHA